MTKTLDKLGVEGNYFKRRAIYKNLTANNILHGEKLNACLLILGIKQGFSLFPPLLNIIMDVIAKAVRQEK